MNAKYVIGHCTTCGATWAVLLFLNGPDRAHEGWPYWNKVIGRCHEGCDGTHIVSDAFTMRGSEIIMTDQNLEAGHGILLDNLLEPLKPVERKDRFDWILDKENL